MRPKPPNAGKGRPKGSRNRISGTVKEMILEALGNVGGAAYLETCARNNPAAFLALLGRVLPMQLTGESSSPVHIIQRLTTRG